MRVRKMLSSAIFAGIVLSVVPTMSFAIGGASGVKRSVELGSL